MCLVLESPSLSREYDFELGDGHSHVEKECMFRERKKSHCIICTKILMSSNYFLEDLKSRRWALCSCWCLQNPLSIF